MIYLLQTHTDKDKGSSGDIDKEKERKNPPVNLHPGRPPSTSWYISFQSLCEHGESRSGVVQCKLFGCLLGPCHVPLRGPSGPHSPHPGSEAAARETLLLLPFPHPRTHGRAG